ncbi:MAG: gliding motility-associated C-terminal domain-containing protein, partial [Bacteroidia bacterium]|nr:gliding motility-associated C-terminal domain-containing protein [Bacteroidia bacterium]
MKKFKDIEEFENLLKDNLGKHSVPAPPDVWSGVSSSFAGNSGSLFSQLTSYFSSVSNIVKVAFFVGGISAAGIVLYNENTKDLSNNSNADLNTEAVDATNNTSSSKDIKTTNGTQSENKSDLNENVPSTDNSSVNTNNNPSGNQSNTNLDNNYITVVDEQSNGDETPASESNQNHNVFEKSQIVLSNNKPCIGEKITLSNTLNQLGDWYINGKKVSSNKKFISYVWSEERDALIELKYDSITINKTVATVSTHTRIVSNNPTSDSYQFTLDNSDVIANWYVDGKLVTTNAKQLSYQFKQVGMHHVKAVPINHSCTSPAETHVTIQPKGELKTYTIFTPNGDGKNDTYIVEISNYETYSIQIFNSENVKVFASNNPKISWNGTEFNTGRECSNGENVAKIAYK